MLCLSVEYCVFSRLQGWSAEISIQCSDIVQQQGECVQNNMHVVSTNFAKTLVCKREYDVIL